MPSDYTDDLRLAHVLADDADSTSQSPVQGARPARDDQAGPHPGHRRGPVGRGGHPSGAVARPAARRRARRGDRLHRAQPAALGGGPDRRHQELRARRTRLGEPDLADGRRRGRRRRRLRPGAEPALVGDEGRRRLDRQVAAARHRVPGLRRLPRRGRVAVLLLPARAGTSAAGSTTSCRSPGAAGAPGRTATSGPTCSWPRAPSTSPPSRSCDLYDMAALDIIVREAGGCLHLPGRRAGARSGGSALATNGKLHDQALAFLGSLPDHGDPHPGGTVHDLSARRGEPAPDRESLRPCSRGLAGRTTFEESDLDAHAKGQTMKINDVIQRQGEPARSSRSPRTPRVRDLLALLAEHNIGAVIVSGDGNAVDGIVSERDVVRKLNGNDAVLEAPVDADHDRRRPDLRARPRRRRADGRDDRAPHPPRPRRRRRRPGRRWSASATS